MHTKHGVTQVPQSDHRGLGGCSGPAHGQQRGRPKPSTCCLLLTAAVGELLLAWLAEEQGGQRAWNVVEPESLKATPRKRQAKSEQLGCEILPKLHPTDLGGIETTESSHRTFFKKKF